MTGRAQRGLRHWAALGYQCLNPVTAVGMVYSVLVRLRLRRCGRGLRLRLTTTILGHRSIEIGENFTSLGHLYLYAHDDGELRIGNDCSVNSNVQFGAASGKIIVGNDVMIAPNVVIRASDHGMRLGEPMCRQPPKRGEIYIEDDVWIGSNAVITADVRVARGTVVAAGAVVTRSTEPNSIVAGVPARKIGARA